ILLDDIALVPAADHEVVHAVGGIDLHDVPEDGLAADLDHRLGPDAGLLADARAEASGQNDRFHRSSRLQWALSRIAGPLPRACGTRIRFATRRRDGPAKACLRISPSSQPSDS